jgi:two-component system, OmpR family, response regulator
LKLCLKRVGLGYNTAVHESLCAPKPATILVIDDDQGVAETFAGMLRLEGYQVRTAADAESGLREAETARPDAIILDLRMPLVDGMAFLRRLRADERQTDVPVAVVTADYLLEDELSAELRRLNAELHFKPLWCEDLVDLTRALLRVTH